jgi:hypothetical protein
LSKWPKDLIILSYECPILIKVIKLQNTDPRVN